MARLAGLFSYPARPIGVEDEIYTWGYVRNGTALSGSERDTTRPLTRGRRGVCLPRSADLTADPFEIGAQVHGPRIGPLPSAPTIRTSVESISPRLTQSSPHAPILLRPPRFAASRHISSHREARRDRAAPRYGGAWWDVARCDEMWRDAANRGGRRRIGAWGED